jgi:hypothetical protein
MEASLSSSSAGQAKIASVPTALRATTGLGYALSGYCVATTAATAADARP